MDFFINTVLAHPLLWLGYLFAFFAALSFLVFLRGFLSGFLHLFTIDHNDEHLKHYRRQTLWGAMLLVALFSLWQVVRFVAAFATNENGPSFALLGTLAVLWTLFFALYQFAINVKDS